MQVKGKGSKHLKVAACLRHQPADHGIGDERSGQDLADGSPILRRGSTDLQHAGSLLAPASPSDMCWTEESDRADRGAEAEQSVWEGVGPGGHLGGDLDWLGHDEWLGLRV